jgi:hypothetical protein
MRVSDVSRLKRPDGLNFDLLGRGATPRPEGVLDNATIIMTMV